MLLYEINARLNGQRFDEISARQLSDYAELGFDTVWFMGVWALSPEGTRMSKKYAPDFQGSPYAIPDYEFNPDLGDEESFKKLRKRAESQGLRLILDFIPNHLARDTPLIDRHPEFFMQGNWQMREEFDEDYYQHPSGRRLAHGKDPYFAGWNDTVQLDYTVKGLRDFMKSALVRLAGLCDGVRCDMAMLVLRDQIRRQWYPRLRREAFDAAMPHEFWDDAIEAAKKVNPGFQLIAEAYWDTEPKLIGLGFDFTYHKRLLDALHKVDSPWATVDHMRHTSEQFLNHSVNFIENHDEDRAAARLPKVANRRAAALVSLLPGLTLIHQGQMEGVTEKIPVQRIKPLEPHEPDTELQDYYRDLLAIARLPMFRKGEYVFAESNIPNSVSFWRAYRDEAELVTIPIGDDPIHVPEYPYYSLPIGANIDLSTGRIAGHGAGRVATEFDDTALKLEHEDVAKAFGPLEILRVRFDAAM